MSSPPPYAEGGYDVGNPQDPPNVYLPQTAPSPAYDAYADPASAHGWQNAYDETRELPPVGGDGPPPADGAGAPPAEPPGEGLPSPGEGSEGRLPGAPGAGGHRRAPGRGAR
ncbi:hypothetical protein ACWEGV_37660, partial [Streptomyces sp. NPDC004976]